MLEEAQQGLVSVPDPKPAPARMILEVIYIAEMRSGDEIREGHMHYALMHIPITRNWPNHDKFKGFGSELKVSH